MRACPLARALVHSYASSLDCGRQKDLFDGPPSRRPGVRAQYAAMCGCWSETGADVGPAKRAICAADGPGRMPVRGTPVVTRPRMRTR